MWTWLDGEKCLYMADDDADVIKLNENDFIIDIIGFIC